MGGTVVKEDALLLFYIFLFYVFVLLFMCCEYATCGGVGIVCVVLVVTTSVSVCRAMVIVRLC
jgi:hypothetical protein